MAETPTYDALDLDERRLGDLVPGPAAEAKSSQTVETDDDTTRPRRAGSPTSLFVEKPKPFDPSIQSEEHVPEYPPWFKGVGEEAVAPAPTGRPLKTGDSGHRYNVSPPPPTKAITEPDIPISW